MNESELDRTTSELEHQRTSKIYHDAERRVQQLQKDLKRSIAKSRFANVENIVSTPTVCFAMVFIFVFSN